MSMVYSPTAPVRQLSPGEVIEEQFQPQVEQEWRQPLAIKLVCQECRIDPPNLVEEGSAGDIICADCGLVLQSHVVDMRSEWRTFSNDDQGNDDPSRVGEAANPLLNGKLSISAEPMCCFTNTGQVLSLHLASLLALATLAHAT
jgi:transcription initiation factor TFIIB